MIQNLYHIFKKIDLDLCICTCPVKFEFGQGHLAIFFSNFEPTCTKISKKNNLKQKSYKDFSFLKICKCVNPHKT